MAKDLLPQSLSILPIPRRLKRLIQREACVSRYRELIQRRIRQSLQSVGAKLSIVPECGNTSFHNAQISPSQRPFAPYYS